MKVFNIIGKIVDIHICWYDRFKNGVLKKNDDYYFEIKNPNSKKLSK